MITTGHDAVDGQLPDKELIGEALSHVLGNTCRIARTAGSYAWNVTGVGAASCARCFSEQAQDLHHMLDPVAEHMRSIGLMAVLDYSDEVVVLNPPTAKDMPDLPTMLLNLRDGHTQAIVSVEGALDVAQEFGDRVGQSLMTQILSIHRKYLWKLSLEGNHNTAPVSARSVR